MSVDDEGTEAHSASVQDTARILKIGQTLGRSRAPKAVTSITFVCSPSFPDSLPWQQMLSSIRATRQKMDWVQLHCDRLRSNLQHVVDGGDGAAQSTGGWILEVPWSWAARSIIETVMRYPSGLTEAVILAELELLWRRDVRGAFVPGKLQAYLDAQYAPLSDVIQACVVRHSNQLVTIVEDHSASVSWDQPPAKVDMYLHQNFKSCLQYVRGAGHDLLAPGRKVRLTGCRLLAGAIAAVTGNGFAGGGEGGRRSPSGCDGSSTLVLTEYLAFVLDHRRSDDVRLAAGAFGRTRVRDTFNANSNHEAFFVVCKVLEIRRPRQHTASSGGPQPRKRRQTLQTVVLECAAGRGVGQRGQQQRAPDKSGSGVQGEHGRGSGEVLLHLWDEQTCLTSLFQKGDGLAVYWPWLVQEQQSDGVVHDGSMVANGGETSSQHQTFPSQLPLASNASGWHFEYGSATALFVLPRESRAQLLCAVNGDNRTSTVVEAPGPMSVKGPIEATTSGGGGGSGSRSRRESSPGTGGAGNQRMERRGRGKVLRLQEMPIDENGVRDVLQFPQRLFVSDLVPNLSNASIYGQVVSITCVAGSSSSSSSSSLPAFLPPCRWAMSASTGTSNQTSLLSATSLSQWSPKPVMLKQQQQQQQPGANGAAGLGADEGSNVVELRIRDEGGCARVFCCGRKAATDALRCRLGQYVLACGLRTFAAANPPRDDSQQRGGGDVVVLCGEAEGISQEVTPAAPSQGHTTGARAGRRDGAGGGGGGGEDNNGRILNTSCLEGLLHCPCLSRHSLLHDPQGAPGPRSTFACKVAVTWARWSFDGDGLWAFHRRCGTLLPCHYSALGTSQDSARQASRKHLRKMRTPGESGGGRASSAQQDMSVSCPLCKIPVRVACEDEAELGYAPLLLALDDGTRCLVAECRSEVVPAALGGINASVFLQMGEAERKVTLESLIGREIRCVVGGDGADPSRGASNVHSGNTDGGHGSGSGWGGSGEWDTRSGRVAFRVERIASANPAADLAHLLSHNR